MDSWYNLVVTCQRQGIDVMSAARMIAWAMELYETGGISKEQTGGIELTWGNKEAIAVLIRQIGKKEGFGATLAKNVQEAAAELGEGVEEALNLKGMPVGCTDVLSFRGRTMGAIVNPRGGDEYRARYGSFDNLGSGKNTGMTGMAKPDSWEARSAMAIIEKAQEESRKNGLPDTFTQHDITARGSVAALGNRLIIVSDALGQCKWNTLFLNVGLSIEFQAKVLSAGLGIEISVEDLLAKASRISAQERLFAMMNGLTRDDDTLPPPMINRKMAGAWPEDSVTAEEVDKMKEEFYRAMGWHENSGTPKHDTLKVLGVDHLFSEIQ
ncbi:aldehyde ferredoxin oxidoreductase C-terminal domain-containing protein [Desulforhopalus singaporensis]|nr:aldehyde ferredoxin oxidoreductase C-terminal domain-containing protein [Desulforhopalus singaporensis]